MAEQQQNHADIETVALALGIWTEARDNSNAGTRSEEMVRVGGVILNRSNTSYRGNSTVLGTVLSPKQFSHFNAKTNPERVALQSGDVSVVVGLMTGRPRWDEAMTIAEGLRSGKIANPWPDTTVRHYYSPRSMRKPGSSPDWVDTQKEVHTSSIPKSRFRWYRGVK